jgi:hypothetical protein
MLEPLQTDGGNGNGATLQKTLSQFLKILNRVTI